MKHILLILLIALFAADTSQAQTLKAYLNAAEEALQNRDVYNAMGYYGEAMLFDTSNLDIRYKYAESAKTFNAYTIAETHYQKIHDNDTENAYPMATFHLAETQQQLGKYEEAKTNYALFLSENSDLDPYYSARAEKEIEAANWAINEKNNPQAGVEIEHLGSDVNSPYSEFGAIERDDELYYSSMRFNKQDGQEPNRLYSQIMKQGDMDWAESDSLDNQKTEYQLADEIMSNSRTRRKRKNNKEDISAQNYSHEAHTSFSADGSRMYYTICEYLNSVDIRCDIYRKSVSENGNFSKATKLPSSINNQNYTSTQPHITTNLTTGEDILYFVSDREGGKGKLDIWYSTVNDDNYSEPENLSTLNTTEDELSPFFHSATNTLYFSSNGYLGMGGLDVHKSFYDGNGYSEAENLKAPTNTSFNDIYYTLNEEGTKAFFSSNRIGSLYLEDSFEACCYDVYRADIEEVFVNLEALVIDELNNENLLGSRLRVYDMITGELLYDNLEELTNDHKLKLKCGREYNIITDRDGYDSDTTSISLKDCSNPEDITKKIFLTPSQLELDVLTYLLPGEQPLDGATVTLYDLSDPNSEPVVITSENNHVFNYSILGGREYKLVATRPGYKTQTLTFKALDSVDGKIIKKLYFDKARFDLNEYLPVIVYFDNDRPDRRSRKLYTNQSYTDTYYPYMERKEVFKSEYSKTLSSESRVSSENDLESFFQNDVKFGFERLQLFVSKLAERLDSGDKIEISLKGFASPRAANKYNLALGQRRIWTLKNEIKQYAGGKLRPYIDSGQLRVSEVSFGEEVSPVDISDSYQNTRLSIYSVEASRQRKAEIVRIRVLN